MKKTLHQIESETAKTIAGTIPRSNVLKLSLVRQILWGEIGGKKLGPFQAFSGGGQKGLGREAMKMRDWDPRKKKVSDANGLRGGALVPGWWIVLPEKLSKGKQSSFVKLGAAPTNDSLRIIPYQLDPSYAEGQRDSFYIHGNGGRGSDGCILIAPPHRQVLVTSIVGASGAWLHAYISGIEMSSAFDQSARADRTA